MKKTLAHIVVSALIPLTLALVACDDEKTSNAIDLNAIDQETPEKFDNDSDTNTVSQEPDSISIESDSVSLKKVLANSGPCSLDRTNGGELAYLTNNEKVGYRLLFRI